jgi:hypothetical protein
MPFSSGPQSLIDRSLENTRIAYQSIQGHRVIANRNGLADICDVLDINSCKNAIGIGLNAAAIGEAVTIVSFGEISESSWQFITDAPVFLGPNGTLTQTIPQAGIFLQVGIAQSATSIFVDISNPIIRS